MSDLYKLSKIALFHSKREEKKEQNTLDFPARKGNPLHDEEEEQGMEVYR